MWILRIVAVLVLPVFLVGSALAAEFPNRPMRYIAATGPGGASDLLARIVAAALSEQLGVQVVVDNRPGAGNTVGAETAARASPDGHTLLGCNIASLAVGPAIYRKLNYDPERDFALLGGIAGNPNVFTVNPTVPAKSIAEFIALAKASPGKLNYAHAGIGTSPQLSMELFLMQAGIQVTHVAYKGVGPALIDLIGGRVQAMTSTVPAALGSVRSGKIRALGVTSPERDPDLPDVPTIAESDMPKFEVISWQGLCTRSGAPAAAIERLRNALAAVVASPEVRKQIVDQGFHMRVMPADQFTRFVRAERVKWAKAVEDMGIQKR
jgi:tripartite-type tricarboxylate transporter receptor subunit TctC